VNTWLRWVAILIFVIPAWTARTSSSSGTPDEPWCYWCERAVVVHRVLRDLKHHWRPSRLGCRGERVCMLHAEDIERSQTDAESGRRASTSVRRARVTDAS
jgi:hypothetical protein